MTTLTPGINIDTYVYRHTHPELEITVGHRPFSKGLWLSKSNLLGQFYYTFSLGKPKRFLLIMNGRSISNPYFTLCTKKALSYIVTKLRLNEI